VESAKALEWFFREGGIDQVDGFGAVTLTPLLTLLSETGGVQLVDYGNIEVTRDNFYNLAQTHAEVDFFPGSTQKRDFLKSVSTQLLHVVTTDSSTVPAVIATIADALLHKEFMFYTPVLSGGYWHSLGWDGSIRSIQTSDYLFINEANLGVNKANCCIARTLTDDLSFENGLINHSLTLTYRNDNPPQPQPPLMWGGGYKNYLRIIVPLNSELNSVAINDQEINLKSVDVEEFAASQAYGFLVEVAGNETAQVNVSYQSGYHPDNNHYSLLFQKQAGVAVWPSTFRLVNTDKTISTSINQDKWITFGLQ